jgi:outer membrane lipoprotein carrier protein
MRYLYVFPVLLGIVLATQPTPGEATPAKLIQRVQKVYESVDSYQADFEQTSTLKMTGQRTEASGTVAFKKPGKMRWVYEKPVAQEIISDGETMWIYQPGDRQVIVSDAKGFLKSRASITFLAGQGELEKEFTIAEGEAPNGAAEGSVLALTPKEPDPTVSRVLLVVDPKSALVIETWVYDFMGNTTRVRFLKPEMGKKLDDARFTFQVPRGVDVIKQNF